MSAIGDFIFALLYLTDERAKVKPDAEITDLWYAEAEQAFKKAVAEAVRREMAALEVVVRPVTND